MDKQYEKELEKEIRKMDEIFEKISNKYKDESEEFLFKAKLNNLINKKFLPCKTEVIKRGIILSFEKPLCFLKISNKTPIRIEFLIKCNFVDEEKKNFLFGFAISNI